jgi:hypothetical protein
MDPYPLFAITFPEKNGFLSTPIEPTSFNQHRLQLTPAQ